MPLFKDHECIGSFATTESALAEIGRLLAAQTSHDPREMLLISVASPGNAERRNPKASPCPSPAKTIRLFRAVPPPHAGAPLTPHEGRVLGLLVEGHNYKTAAIELRVSVNTISFHVRRVYEKLQVHSKSEAVAAALKRRLV